MEWQHIFGFYHVATLGSITKAADATFRTQSALSQQIRVLEEELGCKLFDRIGRRKLQLNSAGEKLLQFTTQFLEEWDQLRSQLKELKGLHAGRLKIAAQFAPLYYLLPEVIKNYTHLFPQVEMTILERPPLGVIDLVKTGEADLGITAESIVPKDLTALRFKKIDNYILTPIGHPLGKEKQVSLEQIAQYPLILAPKFLKYARRNLEEKFETLGIKYRIIMEASNFILAAKYVEIGLGIAIWTNWCGLDRLNKDKFRLIPINHLLKPDHIAIVQRRDKFIQGHKKAFITILFHELVYHKPLASLMKELKKMESLDNLFIETVMSKKQMANLF